jgi:hypothetical protein
VYVYCKSASRLAPRIRACIAYLQENGVCGRLRLCLFVFICGLSEGELLGSINLEMDFM